MLLSIRNILYVLTIWRFHSSAHMYTTKCCFRLLEVVSASSHLSSNLKADIFVWNTEKTHRITGVSDFIHRPDFNNYKKKNKHDVSETASISVLRWGETHILLGPLERANPSNSVCYTPSSESYRIYRENTDNPSEDNANTVCNYPLITTISECKALNHLQVHNRLSDYTYLTVSIESRVLQNANTGPAQMTEPFILPNYSTTVTWQTKSPITSH
jgi:hypothetical protein